MSQNQTILTHLKNDSITQKDAVSRYGCYRLAARISDLKDRGHDIVTIMEPHNGGAHARYYLVAACQKNVRFF